MAIFTFCLMSAVSMNGLYLEGKLETPSLGSLTAHEYFPVIQSSGYVLYHRDLPKRLKEFFK